MGHKTISEQITAEYHSFNEKMLVLKSKVSVNYRSCDNIAASCSTCGFHDTDNEYCHRFMRDDTDVSYNHVCDDFWPITKQYAPNQPPNFRKVDQPGCLSCEYDDKDGFCAWIQDETEYFDNFICDKYQLKENK